MNVFLIQPNISASCAELATLDPVRARKQLLECCGILASVEWALTGQCTMIKKDGQPYGRSHPHHPCVVQALNSAAQYRLTVWVGHYLAGEFPDHACGKSIAKCAPTKVPENHDAPMVVVRRNHPHTYVNTLEEYAALMRPYFLAKLSHTPLTTPTQPI